VNILDRKLRGIEQEKRRVVDIYAAGHLGRETYITKNRALDVEAEASRAKRAQLLARIALLATPQVIDASIAQFCHFARARFDQACDFDSKRRFLLDHIDKITYRRDKATLHGSVFVLSKPVNETKLEFKIERSIDRAELLRPIRQLAARSSPRTAVRRSSFQDRTSPELRLAA
jgi:hypothetical protein